MLLLGLLILLVTRDVSSAGAPHHPSGGSNTHGTGTGSTGTDHATGGTGSTGTDHAVGTGTHVTGHSTSVTDAAIFNTANLCGELASINCNGTGTPVCGSDGRTYENHCFLVQSACLTGQTLDIVTNGSCDSTTLHSTTATTGAPIVTFAVTTDATPKTTVIMTTSTASPPPSTTDYVDPMASIIQSVFCSNAAAVSCQFSGLVIICGSNGLLYPNQCELTKAKCFDNSLTIMSDLTTCPVPGR
ncbi:tomoregulin-2-like [Mya arenaria]|uniref:tomoregulin-2-like n=1 Tax=Mya arenaria TaxID=6604 RepID=UPI0022E7B6F8|nr:tomoregulin-2-like [Mya arenaria]